MGAWQPLTAQPGFPICPAVAYNAARTSRGRHRCPTTSGTCRPANDGLYRFLGGSPLAVAFRLILLSILVGVVLAAIGFDPWNILHSIRLLFRRLWDLGFDAVNWLWRYFLLGAVIVIPIWLLSRLFGSAARRDNHATGGEQPMQLQFVGCGDALGSGGRFNTCFHVTGAHVNFLIDCGASSLPALKRLGIARDDIDLILITHFHGDHFAGLPFLLLDAQFTPPHPPAGHRRAPKASRRGCAR